MNTSSFLVGFSTDSHSKLTLMTSSAPGSDISLASSPYWNIAWFVFSFQKPLWDRISNALPNSIKTEEEEYPMSTTILALIHHEIISEKFVVFNLELFRSTASMTMNLKKQTFRDKNVDPFNLVFPQLEPAFTRSFCQTAHILPGPTVGS